MKNEAKKLDNQQVNGVLPCVMHCTYCGESINETVVYTEDAEPAHEQCLIDFEKHWQDRHETMDLMGF
jgi:hypothetical protein